MNKDAPFWWPSRQTFLGCVVVLAIVTVVYLLIILPKSFESDVLKTLLGALLAWGGMVFQYDYGSSAPNKDKDAQNLRLTQMLADAPPATPAPQLVAPPPGSPQVQ